MFGKPAEVHVIAGFLTGLDIAGDNFVAGWIVVSGRLNGDTVRGLIGDAESKTVSLHAGGCFTGSAELTLFD